MPLTSKGEKIKSAMTKQYGAEKGEQVLYASKNKGTITGIDQMESDTVGADAVGRSNPNPGRGGTPASAHVRSDQGYAQAGGPAITLAQLNQQNRRYWEQPGGVQKPNVDEADELVVEKPTAYTLPDNTPPAGTLHTPVTKADVPAKPLGTVVMGDWDKARDQGEADPHEHPENEEVIEEALEPGLHKRVAVAHKASQEGEDDEKKAKDNEDAVRVEDPHGYRVKADDIADAKARDQDQHPLLKSLMGGLGDFLAEKIGSLAEIGAGRGGDQIGSVMPKPMQHAEVGKSTTQVAKSVRMKPLDKEAL